MIPRKPRACSRDCGRTAFFGKVCDHCRMQQRQTHGRAHRVAIRAESAKRTALRPMRRAAETVLGREGLAGVCARCGRYGYVNGHERLGGNGRRDMTNPDCLLCIPCNGAVEDMGLKAAAFSGWKATHKWPRDPKLAANQARRLDGSLHTFPTSVVVVVS